VGHFGVPIFVEFREPTCEFDVGLRVLEIAAAIAEVRFEVSPILRLPARANFFTPTRSRLRKVASSMSGRSTAMIAIFSGKLLSMCKLKSDGTSLRQARSPLPPKSPTRKSRRVVRLSRFSFRRIFPHGESARCIHKDLSLCHGLVVFRAEAILINRAYDISYSDI
jgi:hypothetical protein